LTKAFKLLLSTLSLITIYLVLYANYNLYYSPELITSGTTQIDADLLKQLNYIENSLDNGVAYEMQKQYPEGFFFSYLMYGLTWCELAKDLPEELLIKKKAIKEAIKSLSSLESVYCKKSFTKNLTLPYGAFYFSWTNYLRAKILLLSNKFDERKTIENNFIQCCDVISNVIYKSSSPFLESYPNQYWPADILPGITSLSLYDNLFDPKYTKSIEEWFTKVETKKEFGHSLFPHSVDSIGKAIQNNRGSSLGLVLILLKEIPQSYSDGLIQLYIRAYSSDFLGLPMIKEYSGNDEETEDIDSGPIIFGNGAVATIVGAGVFKRYGILNISQKMFQTIECVGFPYENSESKKYCLGKFPMADYFIAWVKSLKTLEYRTVNTNSDPDWRLTFQIISFTIVTILIALLFRLRILKTFHRISQNTH
jgi:hypothetical protein